MNPPKIGDYLAIHDLLDHPSLDYAKIVSRTHHKKTKACLFLYLYWLTWDEAGDDHGHHRTQAITYREWRRWIKEDGDYIVTDPKEKRLAKLEYLE